MVVEISEDLIPSKHEEHAADGWQNFAATGNSGCIEVFPVLDKDGDDVVAERYRSDYDPDAQVEFPPNEFPAALLSKWVEVADPVAASDGWHEPTTVAGQREDFNAWVRMRRVSSPDEVDPKYEVRNPRRPLEGSITVRLSELVAMLRVSEEIEGDSPMLGRLPVSYAGFGHESVRWADPMRALPGLLPPPRQSTAERTL